MLRTTNCHQAMHSRCQVGHITKLGHRHAVFIITKTMESGKWVLHTLDCNVHFVIHIIIAVSLEDTGNTPLQSHWKIYDMSLPMYKISTGSAFPLDMTKRPY